MCEELNKYGNCNRWTMVVSLDKSGKVEEFNEVLLLTFTYY